MNKLQLEINKLEVDYYDQVDESLHKLRMLRHDIRNHLIVIDEYAKKQEYKKINEYIGRIQGEFVSTNVINTPSALISSILNVKQQICEHQNIELNIQHQFTCIVISDFNVITILGNILDNAIEAAQKVTGGYINLSLTQLDSYLEIVCENNHCETIEKKQGYFLTTKTQEKESHGIGLKNVERVVKELNGQLRINYTTEIFTISVVLPNYV